MPAQQTPNQTPSAKKPGWLRMPRSGHLMDARQMNNVRFKAPATPVTPAMLRQEGQAVLDNIGTAAATEHHMPTQKSQP